MNPDAVLVVVMTAGVSIAFLTDLADLKGGVVPDRLTYPLIAFGVLAHAGLSLNSGELHPLLSSVEGAGMGFGVGFLVYLFGGLGGGDVKLLAAIGALVPGPVSPIVAGSAPLPGLPVTSIVVLTNGLVLAVPFVAGFALYCLAKGEGITSKEVRVSSLEGGEIPVGAVYKSGGSVKVGGAPPNGDEKVYADPSDPEGLDEEDVTSLRELAEEGEIPSVLEVKRTFPFAPVIAAGTYSLLLFGNLYWELLLAAL